MLLRTTFMASSPTRVFSTASSSLFRVLDNSFSGSDSSADDPYGSNWPRNQSTKTAVSSTSETSRGTKSTTAGVTDKDKKRWPPTKSKVNSATTGPDTPVKTRSALQSSTSQPSFISATAAISVPKPVSKRSKENGIVQPTPEIIFEPPIVHPLQKYSYKNFKPPPARVYVRHEDKADDLVDALTGAIGFDIEWKVVLRKGVSMRPAATVQLSDRKMILIIQLSAMKGFPKRLKALIENPSIVKVGANILGDGRKLARDYGVRAQGLVELGGLARQADVHYVERYFRASEPPLQSAVPSAGLPVAPKKRKPGAIINLAAVTAMYISRALSKDSVRMSDWEVQPLSEAQLEYAANDAHSALMVYDHLVSMARAANIVLEPAKYTTGVEPHYGLAPVSASAAEPNPPVPMPVIAPPMAVAASSSSSTSDSVSTSKYNASSSSSTSTSVTRRSRATNSTTVDFTATSADKFKPIFPAANADVTDDDVEIFETCEYKRSTVSSTMTLSTSKVFAPSESTLDDLPLRTRPGPRFKPSYNTIVRSLPGATRSAPPNAPSTSFPTKQDQANGFPMLASTNPSPERSSRFKPSYNTSIRMHPGPSDSWTTTPLTNRPAFSSSRSSSPPSPSVLLGQKSQQPQHIRAYNLWHLRQLPVSEICGALRSRDNPLKVSTVITYVVSALQTDPSLHFSRDGLRTLLASEPKSWRYYRDWFHTLHVQKYVNMDIGPGKRDGDSDLN